MSTEDAQHGAAAAVAAMGVERPARPRLDPERIVSFIESQPDVSGTVAIADIEYVEDAGGSNGIALLSAELDRGDGRRAHRMVLRYAPGDQRLFKTKKFEDEFLTLRAARAHCLPAAEPMWLDESGDGLGFSGFIMERIEGRAPSPQMFLSGLFAEASPGEREQMLLDAATFHGALRRAAIGPESVPHLVNRGTGETAIERELSWWQEELGSGSAVDSPRRRYAAELAEWLLEHAPDDLRQATLVHGDSQPANMMYRDGRLCAALDWELSYLGHNEADLALVAFLITMHAPSAPGMTGLPSEAALIECYEEAAGAPIEHWEYFQLFLMYRIACVLQVSMGAGIDEAVANGMWQAYAVSIDEAWSRARAVY